MIWQNASASVFPNDTDQLPVMLSHGCTVQLRTVKESILNFQNTSVIISQASVEEKEQINRALMCPS